MGLEVGKGNVVKSAHGLDLNYILGLNLTTAKEKHKILVNKQN